MDTELCDAHRAIDVSSLVNSGLISRAQDAHDEAAARHASALADVAAAEEALGEARAQMPTLFARAVNGEEITPSDVSAAHAALLDAENFLGFRRQVAKQLAAEANQASEVVRRATALAHEPVMDRGIDLRIEAASRADRARAGKPPWAVDLTELDAARALFDEGNDLISLAGSKGCRSRRSSSASELPKWLATTEWLERAVWRREART